ncbi:hypothetical protein AZI86_01020 [Bdellovibrio bacteriovorus]|uniref:N-acetyltransferase domain-containing protein n=1 Tax=Bdellovibrio bacteriovorus TaxID=959 RepID=A0A150WN00_BDEBC|nr:acetyltransferase [Bdellovibrio bacteriovorus]KYG65687.1 hypothetical protein AZI86_01020 [Bdellovibrio bacteriovorus]
MSILSIRHNTYEDADALYSIWHHSVNATHSFLTHGQIEEIGREVKDYVLHAHLLLAIDEEKNILGFMGMTGNKIDSLFISPTHFRKGAGAFLVSHAKSQFKELYVDVNEQNPQAIAFYKKMGFAVIDRSEKDDQGRPFPILKMKL